MEKHSVLIIDDDQSYLYLLSEALQEDFKVTCVHNIDLANKLLEDENHFSIALVDEYIGDEKGSDWIKLTSNTPNAPSSFVLYSGLASEEAILAGLECGADDFLSKPFSLTALNKKLKKLITYQAKIIDFESEIKSKENVINISMAQASKYGSCMQLTSRLNHCFTLEKIRDEVFSFLSEMGLESCIAFYPLNETPHFYSAQKGVCSPVEVSVLKLLKEKSRLFRFNSRTIFNHYLVSLLILNLEDGTIDTDIYIDALASVIEGIGARMEFISYRNSLTAVEEQIKKAVTSTKDLVTVSKQNQQEVMSEIVQNLGMSFHVLDLSMEQEDYLTNLVHSALKKHSQDDVNFLEVIQLLDGALNSIDYLQQLNEQQQKNEQEEENIDDEDELF